MSNILNVIEQLRATTKRSEKEAILKQKDSSLLRRVLELAYNPFINFYQKKIPVYQAYEGGSGDDYEADLAVALTSLKDLSDRIVTGNAAKERLKVILESCYPENAKVIELVVLKDLKCGISAGTINKVFPGLVPEFKVRKSDNWGTCKGNMKYPAYADLKIDGARCVTFVENGKVSHISANGNVFDLFGLYDKLFTFFAQGADLAIDGELLFKGEDGKLLPRKKSNGVANKALKGTITKAEAERAVFVLFDVIPAEDYWKGVCHEPESKRRNKLTNLVQQFPDPAIELCPSWVVFNEQQVEVLFAEVLAAGEEGLVCKNTDAIWEPKRAKDSLKIKAELEGDFLCIGWEHGDVGTKYEDVLGRIVITDASGKMVCKCGSGFSDNDRLMAPEDIVGKIVKISFNAVQTNDDGTLVLDFPVFEGIRLDKNEPDNLGI